MILVNKEQINQNPTKINIFRRAIRRGENIRKFQSLTLKISTSNQIPTNLISFDGYTWIQKHVWKSCSYDSFGHLNQSITVVDLHNKEFNKEKNRQFLTHIEKSL